MTYGELSYRAKKLYTKGKITISEYLEMTKPLDREIEQEPFDIETYCKEHFCVMVDKDVWEKSEKALKENPILDKIRAEVEAYRSDAFYPDDVMMNKRMVLEIIDKYRGES